MFHKITHPTNKSGKKYAILTLLGDSLKGFLLLMFFKYIIFTNLQLNTQQQTILCLCAIIRVFGHVYSIFLKFKGGKGVATTLGVLFALQLHLGLIATALWIIGFAIFRVSGLAAVTFSVLTPIIIYYLDGNNIMFGTTLALSSVIILRHKNNIAQLIVARKGKV